MRYWISWWHQGDDPRPLHYPPLNPRVLGWWRSGYGDLGVSICALVEAKDESQARAAVATDWPESVGAEWRFVEEKQQGWLPNDRFPMSGWMQQRTGGE